MNMESILATFLSVFLFCLSAFLFKNTACGNRVRFFYRILLFCYLLTFFFYFVSDSFTGEGINEGTIYHIKYGLGGAGFLEYLNVIVSTVAMLIFCVCLPVYLTRSQLGQSSKIFSIFKLVSVFALVMVAQLFNPASVDVYSIVERRIPPEESGYRFANYYVHAKPTLKSVTPRSFVFIYLESVEKTYFNEQLFPGLTPHLKRLEKGGLSFSGISQIGNAGWTIAGMVASQCGIPLFSPSSGNSMGGMDLFLPGAYCLGDRLRDEGYELSYFGGAALSFAGKGKFLATHGFTDINGRDELTSLLPDQAYRSFWGIYDDSLFDMVFQRYLNLSEAEENFGLFLLTLDTHHPDGHPSASCKGLAYGDGSNSILNAVACTDQLVGSFVDRIRRSPYGKDTVIVIVSDHLAMRNTATSQLAKGDRKDLFMILDPSLEQPELIEKKGSTYDIASTLLPFIGLGGDIGLGRDLLSDRASLSNVFGDFNKQLNAWRSPIENFWEFPRINESVEILASDRARIDDRSFGLPILIELTRDLDTEIKFGLDLSPSHKNLRDHIYGFDSSTPFIWIDSCSNMDSSDFADAGSGQTCMAIGRLGVHGNRQVFNGNILNVEYPFKVSADAIRGMLFDYTDSVKAALMN